MKIFKNYFKNKSYISKILASQNKSALLLTSKPKKYIENNFSTPNQKENLPIISYASEKNSDLSDLIIFRNTRGSDLLGLANMIHSIQKLLEALTLFKLLSLQIFVGSIILFLIFPFAKSYKSTFFGILFFFFFMWILLENPSLCKSEGKKEYFKILSKTKSSGFYKMRKVIIILFASLQSIFYVFYGLTLASIRPSPNLILTFHVVSMFFHLFTSSIFCSLIQ